MNAPPLYRSPLLGITVVFVIAHFSLTVFFAVYYLATSFQGLQGGWKPSTLESAAFWSAAFLSFPLFYLGFGFGNPMLGLICFLANSVLWGIGFHIALGQLDDWLVKRQPEEPLVFPPISDRFRPDQTDQSGD